MMHKTKNIDFIPGKLYKVIYQKPLYRSIDTIHVHEQLKPGDVIFLIGICRTEVWPALKLLYDNNIKPYTKLLINNMYLESNCSNKSVNCKDIQCCISQAIDVINFSETIYSDNGAFDKIQDYTKYLKSEININCK